MGAMTDAIRGATVRELWRYPVKSMQGERVSAADLGVHGVTGDRGWAVRDLATGLMLTARRVPELLFARAQHVDGDVHITLPDGTEDPDDAALSDWLGRDVRLERAAPGVAGRYEIAADPEDEDSSAWRAWEGPEGSFHDAAPVSLIARGSIAAWDVRRFRPNVLVGLPGAGDDAALMGRDVTLGSAALRVVAPIGRCVVITRPQPGGIDRDMDVLRTVARERANLVGVYALVTRPGRIAVGDRLAVPQVAA